MHTNLFDFLRWLLALDPALGKTLRDCFVAQPGITWSKPKVFCLPRPTFTSFPSPCLHKFMLSRTFPVVAMEAILAYMTILIFVSMSAKDFSILQCLPRKKCDNCPSRAPHIGLWSSSFWKFILILWPEDSQWYVNLMANRFEFLWHVVIASCCTSQ